MSWQNSIKAAVRSLRTEEESLKRQLTVLRGKISELEGLSRGSGAGRVGRAGSVRRLSDKGRLAISRAAKKRWAEYRRKLGK